MYGKLTATRVKKEKRPGLHNDGGGLYLKVTKTISKSWVFRYRSWIDSEGEILKTRTGILRYMGLGPYPAVTLSEARERAVEATKLLVDGVDPLDAREAAKEAQREARIKQRAEDGKRLTFAEAAKQYHETKASEFRNAKHRRDWLSSLTIHAEPGLGHLNVADIEPVHVVKVLKPIWLERTETATRVRQRIEAVLSWATGRKHRTGENPARWKDNLEHELAKPSKVKKVKHHRALPWSEVGAFMVDLRKRDGMSARALEFAILTAARSGEVRLATWSEIDLDAKLWTIPAERIKAGKTHRVPLSEPAVKLLEALPRMEGSEYVFPAARGGPLSDMSLSAVCRRMEVEAVPHGFRSTFKDWARSKTNYADEVSELALAHVNSDATRAAYARDELLPKRTRLMRDWAKFCRTVAQSSGSVTDIGSKKAS